MLLKFLVSEPGDMDLVQSCGPTNIRCHRKIFTRSDALAPGICASLSLTDKRAHRQTDRQTDRHLLPNGI
jgi:hypothetical protein